MKQHGQYIKNLPHGVSPLPPHLHLSYPWQHIIGRTLLITILTIRPTFVFVFPPFSQIF